MTFALTNNATTLNHKMLVLCEDNIFKTKAVITIYYRIAYNTMLSLLSIINKKNKDFYTRTVYWEGHTYVHINIYILFKLQPFKNLKVTALCYSLPKDYPD